MFVPWMHLESIVFLFVLINAMPWLVLHACALKALGVSCDMNALPPSVLHSCPLKFWKCCTVTNVQPQLVLHLCPQFESSLDETIVPQAKWELKSKEEISTFLVVQIHSCVGQLVCFLHCKEISKMRPINGRSYFSKMGGDYVPTRVFHLCFLTNPWANSSGLVSHRIRVSLTLANKST